MEADICGVSLSKFFWDYSGIGILGIDGICVLLGAIPFSEKTEYHSVHSAPKNWVGVCGPLPKTLTLFMTKLCDFPYPIYDLTKNLIPYL